MAYIDVCNIYQIAAVSIVNNDLAGLFCKIHSFIHIKCNRKLIDQGIYVRIAVTAVVVRSVCLVYLIKEPLRVAC